MPNTYCALVFSLLRLRNQLQRPKAVDRLVTVLSVEIEVSPYCTGTQLITASVSNLPEMCVLDNTLHYYKTANHGYEKRYRCQTKWYNDYKSGQISLPSSLKHSISASSHILVFYTSLFSHHITVISTLRDTGVGILLTGKGAQ